MVQKAAIFDAGETLLLGNVSKPWYLHCKDLNCVLIPIPLYAYTVIKKSLLYDSQLQGGNEFLCESLASCPSLDKVDRTMYFTINMAFPHQLLTTFPEAIHSNHITSELTDMKPSLPIYSQDFIHLHPILRV